jgi:multicomponent Na+:H+ antiporter subunit G
MSVIVDALSWAMLLAGGFFCIVGGIGLVRMPDLYTRMHAASVTDTLGVGFMLAGMALQAGFTLVTVKLFLIGALIFFTSPTATHALARAALTRGVAPLLADGKEGPSKP